MKFVDLDSFDLFEIISKCLYNYDDISEELEKKVVDAVPVVRCKDCKYLYFKDFLAYCPYFVGQCKPNGFCDIGKRKGTINENNIQTNKN